MALVRVSYKPVTCIGSRKLPSSERKRLATLARDLAAAGYTVRSGGAAGSDSAFEQGLPDASAHEIYIPYRGWRGSSSLLFDIPARAFDIAAKHHPAWSRCSTAARRLHARNVSQVLGRDLASPSLYVVCWTPYARRVGGTAQALRIADAHKIPIFNLAADGAEEAFRKEVL